MQKIKAFIDSKQGKDILIVLIVILVGLGSFELGRLSKGTGSTDGVKIEYTGKSASQNLEASALSAEDNLQSNLAPVKSATSYFASNRGKKYYPAGCSAGKTIKQENRIYFKTTSEAEAAGYTLSSSCR